MSSVLTVSQLNRYMAFKLKEDPNLRGKLIKGEISNFTNHAKTGHFYFTLKDRESSVRAVMFNNFASRLSFMPYSGMSVIAMANVQVYERDGIYQLYVTDMQPDGLGAMYIAVEQLKERLSAEGLFDERFKQPLPGFPKRIGIVTSSDGAALQDILNIIGRRYPVCEAVIFPCLVQGEYAPDSICEALDLADGFGCDVIICGRGGGSPEDLWAFNSEKVARKVFSMNTPLISAVGHETDTTVIDFVSDLRAPTPSAAAELAVPDMSVLMSALTGYKNALTEAFIKCADKKSEQLGELEKRLGLCCPKSKIRRSEEKLSYLEKSLASAGSAYLDRKESRLAECAAGLDALSPLKVMARGYSLVYSGERLVKSAAELKKGDRITVRFSDSSAEAEIC
ncbi:MAG: exodeoxyribonuclease VII large subunit [Huintestinicola sp.]